MKRNSHKGLFIAFEGLDGSGVGIQAGLLSGVIKKEGYRVLLTEEPTNSLAGGLIRAQLTGEWTADQDTLQLLFAADRSHHLQTQIIPALENGKIVITNRYAFSSVAYGNVDLHDEKWLRCINSRFVLPDITFMIDVSPKICAMRLRKTKYELGLYSSERKLREVWRFYKKIANNYSNIYVIDGQRDEMAIVDEILEITKKRLK